MSVIRTTRNRVVFDDPEPGDALVRVVWFGPPQDGKHLAQFSTRPEPIEHFQQAVDWAVSMADQMVHPLYVVPMTFEKAFPPERLQRLAAGLTGQQRGELRRLVVTTCVEVMRDCDEIEVRQAAYDVLVKTGIVGD